MRPPPPLGAGAAWAALGSASGIAATALVTLIVARLLGPGESGQYAVLTTLFFALAILASLGLEFGVGWLVASKRWQAGGALASGALASLALGTLAAATGLGVRALASGGAFAGVNEETTLIAMAGLPAAVLVAVFTQAAIAGGRYGAAAVITLTQSGAYVAAVIGLAAVYGIDGAAAGLLASRLAAAAIALAGGRRAIGSAAGSRIDFERLREAISFGSRIYVANAVALLIYRFDLLLVNAYEGNEEAGYYAVALATTTALSVLPAALGAVLFPRIASLSDAPETKRREVEDRALRHTVAVVAVVLPLAAILIPLLTEPIFGASFEPAITPALILIPGAGALAVATIVYSALAGRGRPEYAMRIALILAPVAIGVYFVAVPPLGTVGAAIGSDVVYLASAALGALSLRRLSGPSPQRRLRPGRSELRDYRELAARIASSITSAIRPASRSNE